MSNPTTNDVLNAVAAATNALSERKEEVNRLNVFPVPDGDTGTNMSLTMQMVVDNLAKLSIGASNAEIRKAITTGALMGARGNSGVITSQILRGLCEGYEGHDVFDTVHDSCFARAVEVSFRLCASPSKVRFSVVEDAAAAARKRARSFPRRRSIRLSRRRIIRQHAGLPSCPEGEQRRAGGFGLAI
ncbi:MAG: DAK2 domain-containing protein [Slackia sp.]